MGAFNPPLEKGLHFQRKDKDGRIARGWVGALINELGIIFVVLVSDDGQDYFTVPGGTLRTWFSQGDMDQEVTVEYGGMGNFLLGKPGDVTRRGVVREAQVLVDRWLDPTPALPPHTNADPATADGLNETIAEYLQAPEDPTMTNAPQIGLK